MFGVPARYAPLSRLRSLLDIGLFSTQNASNDKRWEKGNSTCAVHDLCHASEEFLDTYPTFDVLR